MASNYEGLQKDVAIIVLFGATGAGKSSFANLACGNTDLLVGHGIKSCTQQVGRTDVFKIDGKDVVVVDCPGFDDTHLSDVEILKRVAGFLAATYKIDIKITGLLYLHRITDNRFSGAASRNFRMFRKMCGTEALENVVFVTNMWSQPPTEVELAREVELRENEDFFQDALGEGAQLVRHSEPTRESAHDIIRRVLDKVPVVPKLASEIIDDKTNLEDTEAGGSLGEDLADAIRKGREEVERLKAEQEEATKEKDKKWQGEIAKQQAKADAKNATLEKEINSLKEGQGKQQADVDKHLKVISDMSVAHGKQVDRLISAYENKGGCVIA